jgi:hypothetical protein
MTDRTSNRESGAPGYHFQSAKFVGRCGRPGAAVSPLGEGSDENWADSLVQARKDRRQSHGEADETEVLWSEKVQDERRQRELEHRAPSTPSSVRYDVPGESESRRHASRPGSPRPRQTAAKAPMRGSHSLVGCASGSMRASVSRAGCRGASDERKFRHWTSSWACRSGSVIAPVTPTGLALAR